MISKTADSLESCFRSLIKGLKAVNEKIVAVNGKVLTLQAENKELRQLWADNEKWGIETKIRVDRLYQVAKLLMSEECTCEHHGCGKLATPNKNTNGDKEK